MNKLASVLIVTRNRSEELLLTIQNICQQTYPNLEIIVVENGSDNNIVEQNKCMLQNEKGIQYFILNENKGVSGGRNVALSYAKGDYIIEIDDDAIFDTKDSIKNAINYLEDHKTIGVLAFKITNYYTQKVDRREYPFRDKNRDTDLPGECTWFIGAGHIFTRQVLDSVGVYREFFPWGSEEQDFSLRALDKDFNIYYYPKINVLHKKSPNGRIEDVIEFASIALKNRLKAASLNLPWLNVMTYFVVRSIQFVLRYKNIRIPFKALKLFISEWDYVHANRKKIKRSTLKKLALLNGQLYF